MYNLDKTNINISSDTEAVLSKFWSHRYILKVIQDTKYNLVHDVAAGNVGAIIQFLQYGLRVAKSLPSPALRDFYPLD